MSEWITVRDKDGSPHMLEVGDCPTSDFDAAIEFCTEQISRCDGMLAGGRPFWQEWALVEAFLAGAKYGRGG